MGKPWIEHPTALTGQLVDLLPLEEAHFDELYLAASDKRIWEFYTHDWSVQRTFLKVYQATLSQREEGKVYPFVIYHRQSQRIIGSTQFLDIARYDRRLEIGGTWMMPEYWATAVNFDCKLALLTFCFEVLETQRVQLKTQHDNMRSRKAIEKIGGVFEGVIRQHMLKQDGTFRSSAMYSIVKDEWERVKPELTSKLNSKMLIEQ